MTLSVFGVSVWLPKARLDKNQMKIDRIGMNFHEQWFMDAIDNRIELRCFCVVFPSFSHHISTSIVRNSGEWSYFFRRRWETCSQIQFNENREFVSNRSRCDGVHRSSKQVNTKYVRVCVYDTDEHENLFRSDWNWANQYSSNRRGARIAMPSAGAWTMNTPRSHRHGKYVNIYNCETIFLPCFIYEWLICSQCYGMNISFV